MAHILVAQFIKKYCDKDKRSPGHRQFHTYKGGEGGEQEGTFWQKIDVPYEVTKMINHLKGL